jgi:hypothetical protein
MTPRRLIDRLLSPAGFGLALLLFLLPFVTVSCDVSGSKVDVVPAAGSSAAAMPDPATFTATYTGLALLTGGDPNLAAPTIGPDGKTQTEQVDPDTTAQLEQALGSFSSAQPLAIVAALVIFVGMVAALFAPSRLRVPSSAAAAVAALALLLVEVLVLAPNQVGDSDLARTLGNAAKLSTRPAVGFYLVVAVLVGVLALQFVLANRPAAPDATDEPVSVGSDTVVFGAQPDETGPP